MHVMKESIKIACRSVFQNFSNLRLYLVNDGRLCDTEYV